MGCYTWPFPAAPLHSWAHLSPIIGHYIHLFPGCSTPELGASRGLEGFEEGAVLGSHPTHSIQFQPQLVLVAAGFDAAIGDPKVSGEAELEGPGVGPSSRQG